MSRSDPDKSARFSRCRTLRWDVDPHCSAAIELLNFPLDIRPGRPIILILSVEEEGLDGPSESLCKDDHARFARAAKLVPCIVHPGAGAVAKHLIGWVRPPTGLKPRARMPFSILQGTCRRRCHLFSDFHAHRPSTLGRMGVGGEFNIQVGPCSRGEHRKRTES